MGAVCLYGILEVEFWSDVIRFMKAGKILGALVAVLVFLDAAQAIELSMEGVVQTALMKNADLAAARYEVYKAEGRLRASGLLPNPEIEFLGLSDFADGNEGENEITVGLYQMFPLTSRLAISREISRVGVAEALREIRDQERLLIAKTQELFIRIQASKMRRQIAENAHGVFQKYSALAQERLESGQGSLAESVMAQIETQRWNIIANEAHVDGEKFLIELKTALNMPFDAPLVLAGSLEEITNNLRLSLQKKHPSQRPDVELQWLALDRVVAEARLVRASAWEGIRIGIEYKQENSMDEPEGLGTASLLGVGVSLPLPVWDRKTGDRMAADATAAQQRLKIRALELQIANAIAAARKQSALYEAQWKNYRTQSRPLLEQLGHSMETGFKEGRVEATDMVSARLQSDTLAHGSVEILENLALSFVEMESVTGTHPAINVPYVNPQPLRKSKNKK